MAIALAGDDLARVSSGRRPNLGSSGRHLRQQEPDVFSRSRRENDDDEELRWAAIERLPTRDRLGKGLLRKVLEDGTVTASVINIKHLGADEKKQLVDTILDAVEEDNEKFLQKLRSRADSMGIETPKIEIRYEGLGVEGDVHVGSRALPTLINSTLNSIESVLGLFRLTPSKKRKIQTLKNAKPEKPRATTTAHRLPLPPASAETLNLSPPASSAASAGETKSHHPPKPKPASSAAAALGRLRRR